MVNTFQTDGNTGVLGVKTWPIGKRVGFTCVILPDMGFADSMRITGKLTVRSINNALSHSANEIRVSVEEVISAATQVAAVSQQLAQGASQQAATLEETQLPGTKLALSHNGIRRAHMHPRS